MPLRWPSGRIDWAPIPLRLALGIVFFAHGAQKVLGWFGGAGWTASLEFFMGPLHIPYSLAVGVFLLEFLGGPALILGVFARWVALALAAEMIVAALIIHRHNGFFMNWAGSAGRGEGYEMNVALLGGLLALVILGSGRWSLDATARSD